MSLSVSQLVLRAKQLEIDAVRHLAGRVEFADVIGQLIHALQRERGATSIYLASGGQRFLAERRSALEEALPIEATLRKLFAEQLEPAQGATARMLSLMAWVLLDLDTLADLRLQIDQRTTTAHESVAAFSRLIAGLVELIFHVADAALHPGISRLLVALVHLVQGKEAAGQERAVGAHLFASGASDDAEQQRIIHLIDAQERSLRVFEEFAEPALRERWQRHQLTPNVALLERLRRTLCTARPGAALDTGLSDSWFNVSSERITEMWQVQVDLVQCLRQVCEAQRQATQQDLQDSEGLLKQLRDNPPPHTHAVDRFFNNAAEQPESAPVLPAMSDGPSQPPQSPELVDLLKTQSARLASMEVELDAARRALHERKVIERAKGALMSRLGITEDAAFRALQKASMDHNRKLLDVAEATLTLPDLAFAAKP
ncbi:nitrate- and nitrite sensing domain-containing protein [Aquabacterium sp. CECT 9606]|uniref:nitrate- and nitrite sensing domain-containing protein n=1 Tax=Aquabacterium sp. CECT 9606 TaxID=2845822 RepID=UPI001E2DCEE2|nr:nitrate- and nitrite sensing domain-containing protein [Aquabacterium sp. CECT 9606]CAH0349878.1 Nitrate regulatory protein [Aquabacterium sp. CECT 9606]